MFNNELEKLSEGDIDKLIADHWREIKGLIQELRRRKKTVLNTDNEPLDTGLRDGRTT
jgi:hypothetical protein